MSWSVGVANTPSDQAAEQIEASFKSMEAWPCPEPEETIKQAARSLLATALASNVPVRNVTVSAWGSQSSWTDGGEGAPQRVSNTFSISIT